MLLTSDPELDKGVAPKLLYFTSTTLLLRSNKFNFKNKIGNVNLTKH